MVVVELLVGEPSDEIWEQTELLNPFPDPPDVKHVPAQAVAIVGAFEPPAVAQETYPSDPVDKDVGEVANAGGIVPDAAMVALPADADFKP